MIAISYKKVVIGLIVAYVEASYLTKYVKTIAILNQHE